MNKYKVCVYAISKNEEKHVEKWMQGVSEADLIIVVDTGSTDNTVKKLKELGAEVYEKTVKPWRFDTARNIAMDYIPKDYDICVSVDLDEYFEKGWRENLEKVWKSQHTRGHYLYTCEYNDDGTPAKQFFREKIHKRKGYRWVHPVHEVLEYNGKENIVFLTGVVLNHHPDESKSREQYLPLLELSAKENPMDDRTIFWLGREYYFRGEYDKGIEKLKQHLLIPSAKWKEERSASMRFIALCYKAKNNLTEAKCWLYKAIAECPEIREPYLNLAKIGYAEKNWAMVFAMCESALKIKTSTGSYLIEPEAWSFSLYDLNAIALFNLKLYTESYINAKKAYQMQPDDSRLKTNLSMIEKKLKELNINYEI